MTLYFLENLVNMPRNLQLPCLLRTHHVTSPYFKKWCVWVLFKGICFETSGKCGWVLIRAYADSLRFRKFSPVSMHRTVEGLLQESVSMPLEGAGRVARKEGRFDQCFTRHSHPPQTLQQKIMLHMCQLCLGTGITRESTAPDPEFSWFSPF